MLLGRKTFKQLPDSLEEFNIDGWNSLVEYATVYSADDIRFTFKNGQDDYTYAPITIINRKGFDLPTTGGFGTLLFSGIGVLLVVAGVGVLLSLKKKNRA